MRISTTFKKGGKHDNIGFNKHGLEITSYTGECAKDYKYYVVCTCYHCGKENVITLETSVLSGLTKSCGCENIKINKEQLEKYHRNLGHRIRSDHTKEENKEWDKQFNFYNTISWKNVREEALKLTDKCIKCSELAELVHHTYSKYYFPAYELNLENLVSMCRNCHQEYHQSLKFNCSIPATFENWLKESKNCIK